MITTAATLHRQLEAMRPQNGNAGRRSGSTHGVQS